MIRLILARNLNPTPYEVTIYIYSSEHEIKTSTFVCRGPNVEITLKSIQGICEKPDPYINWQCVSLLNGTSILNGGAKVSKLLMLSLADKLLKV